MWPFNRKTFDVNNLDKISDRKFIKGLPVFLNKNVVLHPLKKRMFNIGRSIPKQYTYLLNEESLKLIFERLVKVNNNLIFKNSKKLFSFMLETSTSPYIFNSKGDYNDENPLMKELRSIINGLIVKNEIYKEHFETLTDKKDMDFLNTLLMDKNVDTQYKNKIMEFVYNNLMDAFNEIKKEQVNENSGMIRGLAYDKKMLCNINYKNANNDEWISKISNALMNILSVDDIKNEKNGHYIFNKSSLVHFTLKNSNLLFNPILIDDFFKDITENKNSDAISDNTLIGRVLNIIYNYPDEKYNKNEVLKTYFHLAMHNKISGFIDKEQIQEVFKRANKEIIELIFDKNKNESSYPFIFFNNNHKISNFDINAKKYYYDMISIIDAINPEFIKEMNKFEFDNPRIRYYLNDVNNFDYLYYIFENKYMVNNKEHFNYSDESIITKLIKNAENLTSIHKVEKYIKNEELFSIMDSNIISYMSSDFSKLLDDRDFKNEDNVKNIILNEKFKMDYLLNLTGNNSDRISFMSKLLQYYKNPEDEISKKYKPDMEIELRKVNACKELSLYFTDKISNLILSNDYISIKSLEILSQKLNEEDNINLFIKNVNDKIKEDYIDIIFNNENNPILKTYFEKRMITKVIKESDVNLTESVNSLDTERLTITETLKKKKRL